MRSAWLQIHGAAGDLLAPERRQTPFQVQFELPSGLRDIVQSTGVPHVELGDVRLNGDVVEYSALVDDGDRIEAWSRYPLSEPPENPTFILDVHLGRLAHYLRLVGFDTGHDPDASDPALAARSVAEGRILLTRDRGLLMRAELEQASFIRATDPRVQFGEVLRRFALRDLVQPLTRCLVCNGELASADRREVECEVPSSVRKAHTDFSRCTSCRRVYWRGSHHTRMMALVEMTLAGLEDGTDGVAT